MKISESVRAAMVPDQNPMHPGFTSMYLIGTNGSQSLTIDSGEAMERYQWFLRGYLAAIEKAEIGLTTITHHHRDHSGNLKWAQAQLKTEVMVPESGKSLLRGMIPAVVQTNKGGDVIELDGGVRVDVISTPGHSVDSTSYYIEKEGVLFTGDTLLGSSTTTVGNLSTYMKSLQTLLALPNLKVICPGHGAIVNDPRERLQSYVDHRNERERQIIGVLQGGRQMTSWDIMMEVYPKLSEGLRRGADGNVRQHLRKLIDEGVIKEYAGTPRKPPSKAKIQREREHARQNTALIRRAKALEAKMSREALRAQENPMAAQFIEPPRFELS